MTKTDEEIRRGQEAERLMNEPLLREALGTVEQGLVDAMKRANVGDQKTHHELVLALQLLGRIEGHLREVMTTGRMARMEKESLAQKAKRLIRAA